MASTTVNVHEAKTSLSELLRRVEAGEEIVIARGNTPVAVLSRYDKGDIARKRAAGRGSLAGQFPKTPDSVLVDPMSDEDIANAFGGEFLELMHGYAKIESKAGS
jgi:prevent-host-death family protein